MNKSPAVIASTPGARFEVFHFTSAAANTQNPVVRALLYQAAADLEKLQALEQAMAAVNVTGG